MNTTDMCGPDCINVYTAVECTRKNCSLRETCTNRTLQTRPTHENLEVFRTRTKGLGLRCTAAIQPHAFLAEYVGVYTPTKSYKRPTTPTQMYGMHVSSEYIIDASKRGNLARFINHSCQPNSKVRKWVVNRITRLSITSLRQIQPYEEITINYFATKSKGDPVFKCKCGTTNCKKNI